MANALQIITGLLQDAGISSVLRERLALAKDQLELMEKENVSLKKENARLVKENKKLAKQLEQYSLPEEFVEYRGILLRKSGGGYAESAYCPRCKIPMSSIDYYLPMDCSKCGQGTSITPSDIPDIIKKLQM